MARPPGKPANLYQRGDVWWGRIKVAGREHRSSLRTSDRREAARRLKAWRLQLERAELGDSEAPTFKAAAVRWATEVLPKAVRPAVAKRYLVSVRQLEPVFGDLRMDQITAITVGNYISRRSQEASNATIRRDLTALSRLLAACVAWGWRTDNPARVFDRSIIRERRDVIEPPSPSDVATVIADCPLGLAQVLRVLDATGMRLMEAVTLDGRSLDHQERTLTLYRTKAGRPRVLRWATPAADATPIFAPLVGQDGVLFPSRNGSAYVEAGASSNIAEVVRRVAKRETKAGRPFRRFRAHDLRHAFAIRWLKAGGGIYALSRHLGHTSVKTTEGYLRYLTAEQAAAALAGGT